MKKVLLVLVAFCLSFLPIDSKAGDTGYKWGAAKTDSVLCELLNIPQNDPFFTPTVRADYLKLGALRVSATIGLCPFRGAALAFAPGEDAGYLTADPNVVNVTGVIRDADTDSAYSLIEISPDDVGQKEIATSSPARYYWWISPPGLSFLKLYIYPPTIAAGDTAWITIFATKAMDNIDSVRQIAHDKILLYALYKCYFQMGEIDIADKLKEIVEVLLLDQKNILENRPIDITVKKRVLSK